MNQQAQPIQKSGAAAFMDGVPPANVDLDGLIKELETPKEQYDVSKATGGQSSDLDLGAGEAGENEPPLGASPDPIKFGSQAEINDANQPQQGAQAAEPEIDEPEADPEKTAKTAKMVVRMFDMLAGFGLSYWSLDTDEEAADRYRLRKYQMEEIGEELEEVLDEYGQDLKLPPWLGLAVAMLFAYVPLVILAGKQRKANLAAKAEKAKQEAETQRVSEITRDRPARPVAPAFDADAEVIEPEPDAPIITPPPTPEAATGIHGGCAECGRPLTKQQKKFCSRKCKADYERK